MGYAYRRSRLNLTHGLMRLNLTHGLMRLTIDQHMKKMLQDIGHTWTIEMYLIPSVVPHYVQWDYPIPRKRVVIIVYENWIVLEPLDPSQLDGAFENEEIYSGKELSSGEKIDQDWYFKWVSTLECHVVIIELDEEQELQQNEKDRHVTTFDDEQGTEQPVNQAPDHIDSNWDEPEVDNVYSDQGLSYEMESININDDANEPRRRG
ncbi:hypothetical protein Fot_38116 [Forsythia ovata]|uniref:Uncharacterized protein n=1 Tax=Forsythia ovata TaxID=205694 RepID=A0ABD1S0W7_9LAMI